MFNKYGFQVFSERHIKRLIQSIDLNKYHHEGQQHEIESMVMAAFFNLINSRKTLAKRIKETKHHFLCFLFFRQNLHLKFLCYELLKFFHSFNNDENFSTARLFFVNTEILNRNKQIDEIIDLLNNYDNVTTKKIHSQLFTELGDILICRICVLTIDSMVDGGLNDEYHPINNLLPYCGCNSKFKMVELKTPPF